MRVSLLLFFVLLIGATSCHRGTSAVSGTSVRLNKKENGSSFSAKRMRKSKPPQMGFYRKKEKTNVFATASHKVKYIFANDKKRHVLDNDRRATSTKSNRQKQSASLGNMNSTFVKGKSGTAKGKNKSNDNNADAFSKNPNKKGGLFKRD